MDRNCDKISSDMGQTRAMEGPAASSSDDATNSVGGEQYWRGKFEQLQRDFDHLQRVNQNLEDKLLNVVETFEKKREELVANVEYEKSTLMADVNKLSTKLVDARIKLHDFEEKEILHAAECSAPCHRGTSSLSGSTPLPVPQNKVPTYSNGPSTPLRNSLNGIKLDPRQVEQMANDPNII